MNLLCEDEWGIWQKGYCGTYAFALKFFNPSLKPYAGIMLWGDSRVHTHIFMCDDKYAYDSAGKHSLPYYGVDVNSWQEVELIDLDDFAIMDDEAGPEGWFYWFNRAIQHIVRNRILD